MAHIILKKDLPLPPDRTWSYLTNPDLLAEWLFPTDFKAEEAFQFSFKVSSHHKITGEVLTLTEPVNLAVSWNMPGYPRTTYVWWKTSRKGAGCLLELEHSGLTGLRGWLKRGKIRKNWKKRLEKLRRCME